MELKREKMELKRKQRGGNLEGLNGLQLPSGQDEDNINGPIELAGGRALTRKISSPHFLT